MFLCLVLFSLSLVSCKKNIEVFYEEAKEYEVYVVEDKTNKVECLALSYPVTSAESIFSLYTTYQNHIPLGYNSPASPNITLLDCQVKDKEIFFTSGGTESDNMALIGGASANNRRGRHIITTQVEHPAILQTCKYLEAQGYGITYLPVNAYGQISLDDLQRAIGPDTILVSINIVRAHV